MIGAGETTELPPITLVQTLPSNSKLRIVLTWGASPYDLDSHLTGPVDGSTSRFHVFYYDRIFPVSSTNPIIQLDGDGTSGYGPETITINSWATGSVYRYSVFNYLDSKASGAVAIAASPASVRVYGQTGLLKTYSPPSATETSGNTWVVFEITTTAGGTFAITDIDTWSTSGDSFSVAKK